MASALFDVHKWWWLISLSLINIGCTADAPTRPEAEVIEVVPTIPTGPMNLLFIAVDTLRADHIGTYGFKRPTSSNINELLGQSTVFKEAMSTAPWTLPSFASMMTSQYTSTHGCWKFSDTLDESFPTLAEQLSKAGYHTGAVVGHIFLGQKFGLNQGFDDYDDDLVLETLGDSHQAITSHVITDKAIAFLDKHLEQRPEQPWFLWTHYFDPHVKYQNHEGITEIFGDHRRARYNGEIAYTDAHLGRLLKHIKEKGLEDNTVIVFVSDHGEEFLDHGDRLHGKTLYREVIRVPLGIKVPNIKPRTVAQPISTVDIMPTLLDLLNIPTPTPALAGQSLVPLFRNQGIPRRSLLMQTSQNLEKNASLKGIINGEWKLIIETPHNPDDPAVKETVELYRWVHDPREKEDMASVRVDMVNNLRTELDKLVGQAQAKQAAFKMGTKLRHSEEEINQLRALGYVDGDDSP